jgi:nucleotide-binding universal stress UspA family protein
MPVLVAIDGTWHSGAALQMAAQIALLHREPLTVLTVVKPKTGQGPLPPDEILTRIRAMDLSGVPDVQTKVRYGHPAAKIVREAEEGNYALVVVGARQQRNSVGRRLLGSTAIRVAEHAPGPVIVAKDPIRPIRQILLCDSGSMDPAVGLPPNSSGARVPAGKVPSVLGRFTELPLRLLNGAGEIVVMHVMSQMSAGPGVPGKQLRSEAEALIREHAPEGELLERDIEALQRMGLRARAKVSRGLVVEEILEEAQRGDYDLVVIGAYRGQGWQRILLEDLAHRIISGLDRSVLVVR